MKNAQVIRAGEDCWIEANNIIDVTTGLPINVTGYAVHAVARARWTGRRVLGTWRYQPRMIEPVIAEWSTSPTGTQGTIIAGGAVTDRVQIHITPTQSSGWRCPLVSIQAEMTNPATGFVSRIISEVYELDMETVVS
jgi:hypothetical protein